MLARRDDRYVRREMKGEGRGRRLTGKGAGDLRGVGVSVGLSGSILERQSWKKKGITLLSPSSPESNLRKSRPLSYLFANLYAFLYCT